MREQIAAIWQKYDTNGNGILDKKEAHKFLRDYMYEVTGEEPTLEDVERNFDTMDTDKSNDIDKEECLKFLKGFKIGHQLKILMAAT